MLATKRKIGHNLKTLQEHGHGDVLYMYMYDIVELKHAAQYYKVCSIEGISLHSACVNDTIHSY